MGLRTVLMRVARLWSVLMRAVLMRVARVWSVMMRPVMMRVARVWAVLMRAVLVRMMAGVRHRFTGTSVWSRSVRALRSVRSVMTGT